MKCASFHRSKSAQISISILFVSILEEMSISKCANLFVSSKAIIKYASNSLSNF